MKPLPDFWSFWLTTIETGHTKTCSIRDIVSWINFIQSVDLSWQQALVHGGCLIFVDRLLATGNPKSSIAYEKLVELAGEAPLLGDFISQHDTPFFGIEPFFIPVTGTLPNLHIFPLKQGPQDYVS